MNLTILISALVGAGLGTGFVLVFIPRKVTYRGISPDQFNHLVEFYNLLDGDTVELRSHLIELDEKFLNHSHEPINTRREVYTDQPRREVTGYISAAPDYDDEPPTRRTRASRNLSTNRNPDPRIRRGSEGRGGY